jgi:hypothetical protein
VARREIMPPVLRQRGTKVSSLSWLVLVAWALAEIQTIALAPKVERASQVKAVSVSFFTIGPSVAAESKSPFSGLVFCRREEKRIAFKREH